MGHTDHLGRLKVKQHTDLLPTLPNSSLEDGFTGLEVSTNRTVTPILETRVRTSSEEHLPFTQQKDVGDDWQSHA